jgi:hypothetical protein
MSRAMNLGLPEAEVKLKCEKAGVQVSAIEPLPSGGTHLVCLTSEGAETMRGAFKSKVIEGRVKRFPYYVPPSRW